MSQNKYDDEQFFKEYMQIRKEDDNANVIEEAPALFSLINKDLSSLSVLDLGCGFGQNSQILINRKASRVVGIDVSKKMLELAKKVNNSPKTSYYCIDMENIDKIEEKFDLVISSLAVHYVKDFNKLVKDIYNLLNDGGEFIFSQEHPITLAPINGKSWNYNENNEPTSFNLSNYQEPGERNIFWLTNNVIKYHRTISEIINTLIDCGFTIEKVLEPEPIQQYKDSNRNIECKHKPHFLMFKCKK